MFTPRQSPITNKEPTYSEEAREAELQELLSIQDADEKLLALQDFVFDEKALLNQYKPPRVSSIALDTAKNEIYKLENPNRRMINSAPRFYNPVNYTLPTVDDLVDTFLPSTTLTT